MIFWYPRLRNILFKTSQVWTAMSTFLVLKSHCRSLWSPFSHWPGNLHWLFFLVSSRFIEARLAKWRRVEPSKVKAAGKSNVLAVRRRKGWGCQKIEVQKADKGKFQFPIVRVIIRVTIRVRIKVMVRGWASGYPCVSVTTISNVLERRPCKARPSDTFNHLQVDMRTLSTCGKSTMFRSTYHRTRPNGFDAV